MTLTEAHIQPNTDPMLVFTFALRAAETKRQWPKRLKVFFDFLDLEGVTTIDEQANQFVVKARQNIQWTQEVFIRIIRFQ